MTPSTRLRRILRSLVAHPRVRDAARTLGSQARQRWREHMEPHSAGENAAERRPRRSDARADTPITVTYAPRNDAEPDPGEIVWGHVPFEDDPSRGKDRPLLVLALDSSRGGTQVVGLMLTSRDRGAGDHIDRHGNRWVDIGTGSWDRQGRPSEVRVDRLIRIPTAHVRREGGRLDRDTFDRVVAAARSELDELA